MIFTDRNDLHRWASDCFVNFEPGQYGNCASYDELLDAIVDIVRDHPDFEWGVDFDTDQVDIYAALEEAFGKIGGIS